MIKIIRTATIPFSIYILLKGQLKFLNDFYEVIAVSGNDEYLQAVKIREGVKVSDVKMERRISFFKDIVSLLKLINCFKKERPYIVHSITPKAGLLSMIAAYFAGVPIRMHTFTGLIFPSKKGLIKILLINMDRLLCKMATHVYPEGEGVKSDLLHYKITKKPLKVLANGNINGINLEHFSINNIPDHVIKKLKEDLFLKNDHFVFLFVGRLVIDKGIVELISAFVKLYKIQNKVRLILVGKIENDQNAIPSKILKDINSHPGIKFVGFQEDVRPYYAVSDSFVFPSYREGFPNVVLEAGAMNLPSIVTDINGSNEIISNNVNGLIIPSKNEQELLEAMCLFCTNIELISKLRENTRKIISQKFDQNIVWNALLKEYKSLNNDL